MKSIVFGLILLVFPAVLHAQSMVPDSVMQKNDQEVKTPYRFGLERIPESAKKWLTTQIS